MNVPSKRPIVAEIQAIADECRSALRRLAKALRDHNPETQEQA